MSTIGRYEYKKSCTLLVQLFDESVQTYQSLISSGQTGIEIAVQEGVASATALIAFVVVHWHLGAEVWVYSFHAAGIIILTTHNQNPYPKPDYYGYNR